MRKFGTYGGITLLAIIGVWGMCGMFVRPAGAQDDAGAAGQAATHPSVQEQVIRVIQCEDSLHKIGQGIMLYSNNHTGKYPPDLGTLLIEQKMKLTDFICPAAASALPDHWQKMTAEEQGKWVNAHTDYVYLGAKWNIGDHPDAPLVCDKDDDHGGQVINILYGDFHVGLMTVEAAHQHFGAQLQNGQKTTRIAPAPGQAPAIALITVDQAKAIEARQRIETLKTAVESFEIDNGRYPTTAEGLKALTEKPAGDLPNWRAYIDEIPVDPWNHPYVYACPGTGKGDYDLYSSGPDGKAGTDDDVK